MPYSSLWIWLKRNDLLFCSKGMTLTTLNGEKIYGKTLQLKNYPKRRHSSIPITDTSRTVEGTFEDLGFQILPVNEKVSHRAMIYIEEYVLKSGMDIADALIAATASEHSMTVCTANNKHYAGIPGIQITVFRP